MRTSLRPFLPLLLLLTVGLDTGCKSDEEQAADLYDEYAEAVCRIYSDETCVQNMSDNCFFSISFDSVGECKSFLIAFSDPQCDSDAVLLDNQDTADDCIADIEGWDCDSQPLCDDEGNFMPTSSSCATIDELMEDACPTTAGSTTY